MTTGNGKQQRRRYTREERQAIHNNPNIQRLLAELDKLKAERADVLHAACTHNAEKCPSCGEKCPGNVVSYESASVSCKPFWNYEACPDCPPRIDKQVAEIEQQLAPLRELEAHDAQVTARAQGLRQRRHAMRQRCIDEAGPEFAAATFGRFEVDFDPDRLEEGELPEGMSPQDAMTLRRQALEATQAFGRDGAPPWLVLAGPPGRGKTLLVAAWLARRARPSKANPNPAVVPFRSEAWWCARWKSAADHRFDKLWKGPDPDDVVAEMVNADVLALDDLGDGNVTQGWLAAIRTVLHTRHRNHAPVIVTTNMTPQQIAEAYGEKVRDRMRDQAVSRCCMVPGPSFRRSRIPAQW